jgi:hypothetical protein
MQGRESLILFSCASLTALRSLRMLVDSLALFQELGIDFISYKESVDTQPVWVGSFSILIAPMQNLNGRLSGTGRLQA